jgi:hypothetical protein
MAGRPKREEAVTPVLLRIPPALLARVNRCKAWLELQGDISLSRTEVFWRLLEMGCGVLESQMSAPEKIPDSLISEISKEYEISKISKIQPIAGDQPEQPPQAPRPPSHLATVEEPEPMAAPVPPMATPQPAIPLALEPAPKATLAPMAPQVDAPPPPPLVTHETLTPSEEADQEPAPAAELPVPEPPPGVQTVHLPEPRESVPLTGHIPDHTTPAGLGRLPEPPQEPRLAAPMPPAPQPPSHLETVEELEPMAPPMAVPQAPEVPSPEAPPVEETPQPTKPPMVPTGMRQCRYGHEFYPASRSECPTCVRNRKRRQRGRQPT